MDCKVRNKILVIIFLMIISILLGIIISGDFSDIIDNLKIIMNGFKGESHVRVSILLGIRIPRVLLSFLVGGMLAISGVIMQSVLRNPLASSYTMGVSSGASLGIGIFLILNLFSSDTSFLYSLIGFIFSILTTAFVIFMCKRFDFYMRNNSIILIGMIISLFLNSLLSILTLTKRESLSSILIWQMGSFSSRGWGYLISVFPFFLISFILVMKQTREMDILTFGDEMCNAIGINSLKLKINLLIISSILTGASIATSGVIGFIDLIIPHICRKLFGARHGIVIPTSVILGGIFMVNFDTIARTIIYPSEIPISIINSLIGTPIFCYIFLKMKGREGTY